MSRTNGKTPPTVAILIPTHDAMPALTAYDLTTLYGHTIHELPPGAMLGLTFSVGTYVHAARWELLQSAIEAKATHLCWIDADMRFPKDALMRLLKHDMDVVGINYCTRGLPPRFVSIRQIGVPGSNLPTTEDSTGLERTEAMGFGFLLMKMSALVNLPRDGKPWFWFDWMQDRDAMVGEDVYFFRLLKDAGIECWVDHDLSKECRHIGGFEFAPHHVEAWHSADMEFQPHEPAPLIEVVR